MCCQVRCHSAAPRRGGEWHPARVCRQGREHQRRRGGTSGIVLSGKFAEGGNCALVLWRDKCCAMEVPRVQFRPRVFWCPFNGSSCSSGNSSQVGTPFDASLARDGCRRFEERAKCKQLACGGPATVADLPCSVCPRTALLSYEVKDLRRPSCTSTARAMSFNMPKCASPN